MSNIHFTDGMSFNLQGPLRIIKRSDGFYVVGKGMLCPVENREDGECLIEDLRNKRAKSSS